MTALESYCSEIGKISLLTPEDEQRFGRLAMEGDQEAQRRLVEGNLRLVVRIAREYCGMGIELEDLVSIGNLGLMRAAEKFDVSKNAKFSTYCAWWVKAHIRAELRRRSHTPEATAVSVEEELVGDGEGNSVRIIDLIADESPTAGERIERDEQKARALRCMRNVLAHCSQRNRELFVKRLGLGGEEPMTLKELHLQYGITDSAIDVIVKGMLAKMREQILAE